MCHQGDTVRRAAPTKAKTMTAQEFRELALSLPEAEEGEHMGHADFRVRGKIFATLGPEEDWGMAKLKPGQQSLFVRSEPDVFQPVKGGWGRGGATRIELQAASEPSVRQVLIAAWRNAAPKSVARILDDGEKAQKSNHEGAKVRKHKTKPKS